MFISDIPSRPPENATEVNQLPDDILGENYVFDEVNLAWLAPDENYRVPGRAYVWVNRDWRWGRKIVAPTEVQ
jgi:hypothetical protein